MSHTPGPWIVGSDKTSVLQVTLDAENPFQCVVNTTSGYNAMSLEEAKANARLIAGAPNLLAALKAIVSSLLDADEEGLIDHAPEIMAAKSAIAKAEGTA